MLRLLLIRHGETAWNASSRYQGHADVPLNEAGCRQAVALAERLAVGKLEAIYTSDLKRAWQTAQIVAGPQGLTPQADPRLRELDFGAWQGLTYRQIAEQDPDRLAAWNADRVHRAPPRGESLAAMAQRVGSLITELRATHTSGAVALVGHGGSIRMIPCLLLEHPLGAYWQFEVDNTALAEIELQERGPVLTLWNDTHHLGANHRQSVF
ncbi:MAG: alpha-ribazole phosphatase [Anaerolineae bacterium]